MSTKFKRIFGFIVCVCLCLCFFACGDQSSISISGKNRISMEAGATYTLKVTGISSGDTATYESSDETVATVSGGKITAIKEGEAVITVKAGEATASVTVVVRKRTVNVTVNGELQTVNYGEKLTQPADPVKPADAQYTYTFKGWYVGNVKYDFDTPVTESILVEAVYEKTLNRYDVTIGTEAAVKYEYGSLIESPENPVKASTEQYDYVFKGWYNGEQKWDFAADKVTENVTLTAKFDPVERYYMVTFDGKNAVYLKYGEKVAQPEDPAMAADAQYTYEFAGWYNGEQKWNFETDTVSAKTELKAKFEEKLNEYTVTVGENVMTLAYGTKIAKPVDPVKAADAQYTYAFKNWITKSGDVWDFENDVVIGDTTLIADYTATINKYVVSVDGAEAEYVYGTKVARPATPVKAPDGENTYYFDKYVIDGTDTEWNFDKDVVTGALKLTAVFKKTTNKYLISFGGVKFAEYEYGAKIEQPEDPVREADNLNEYYFDHWEYEENGVKKTWDFETDTVTDTKPGTLTPIFTAQARAYNVVFMNDGVEFAKSSRVRVGETVTAPQTNPEKEPSATMTYTFVGWYNDGTEWDFENDTLGGPLTLEARYDVAERLYNVTFNNGDKTTTEQYVYGSIISKPADPENYIEGSYRYEFAGWVNAKGEQWNFTTGIVTEELALIAKYNPTTIRYEVTYVDEYGNFIYTFMVKDGDIVPEILSVSKEANVRYSYNFRFWTQDGEKAFDFTKEIKSDIVLQPVFEQITRKYTVTLKNYDETVFDTMQFEYGTKFEYPTSADLPLKDIEGDDNSYAFIYWADALDGKQYTGEITANVTLYAVYEIDNNMYTVVYYDYEGNVIEGATQSDVKRNKLLTLPNVERENTKEIRYTFIGWATDEGGQLVYAAGKDVRCSGNMNMYPLYNEETIYYYVSANLTDVDATYVLTDVNGTPLTDADLKLTYNTLFTFKAAVNSEAKGTIVIKRGGTVLTPDADGVYSFNVRDELVRVSVSGLTLRRYTVTDNVIVVKQSDSDWAKMVSSESDIIVKLTKDGEVSYIENAVAEGIMKINGLVAGNYTVEYVAKDAAGGYRNISEEKYVQNLNAQWAVENGQDETMTWNLGGSRVGHTPVTISGDYKWTASELAISADSFHDGQSATITLNELKPGTADFITTVTYDKMSGQEKDDGPSVGFSYTASNGTWVSVYFVAEGKIRIVNSVTGWDGLYQSQNLLCSNGAILNMYTDCYTHVTVTHVKKGAYLYLFGSFSRPNSNVVAVTDRLLGVIDTSTGTLYTNSQVNGSSCGFIGNPLKETGVYAVYQSDYLKALSDITGVNAYYGITNKAPVQMYGINYSYLAEDVARYADKAVTKVKIDTDNHVNVRVANPTGKYNEFNVWQNGSLKFVPDKGYVIDKVYLNGQEFAASVNKDGHFVINFNASFVGYDEEIKVTSKAGSLENLSLVSGTVSFEGKAIPGAGIMYVGRNAKYYFTIADQNGKYELMLPAGSYYVMAYDSNNRLEGYDYNALKEAYDYAAYRTVSGTASDGNIEFVRMTGGYNTGITVSGDTGITYSGTSDETFVLNVRSKGQTQYILNRTLADGQLIKFSLKFNEDQGKNNSTWVQEAVAQDMYLKFNVGGQNLGIASNGNIWGGTAIKTSPFSQITRCIQEGWTEKVYDFAYARQGNRVYLLVKYSNDDDYVAVSYADVTVAEAQINLIIAGAGGRFFDYTFSNFGFVSDKTTVNGMITEATSNVTTSKVRNVGNADENGAYNGYINGSYGVTVTDTIYNKKEGSAVITAKIKASMKGYGFIGFLMRDPATGNFVNIGMNSWSVNWITSVQNGNGWGYRSAVMINGNYRIPKISIGEGNSTQYNTEFTLKAVVTGDVWTVYYNDVLVGSIDLQSYWKNNYIGGGKTSATVNGDAKHGWSETQNLYPTADNVQFGIFAYADSVSQVLYSDMTVELCPTALLAGTYVDNISSVKNSEDLVYTAYVDKFASDSTLYNTVSFGNTVGIKDGEAFLYTMQYNTASGTRKAHGSRVSGNRNWGDMYIRNTFDGLTYDISSGGCTTGRGEGYTSATVKYNNLFDFSMDRDQWNGITTTVVKYDFALVKAKGKLDLYVKYNGATEWALMYTANNTNAQSFMSTYVSSAGEMIINVSYTGVKIVKATEVLSHTWEYAKDASWYSSASKTINNDGSAGYNIHLGTSGTKQWSSSVFRPVDVYNAKDNTVIVDGDYSLWVSDANWSMAGWNFADANSDKRLSIGFRTDGSKNLFVISYASNSIDNYGKRFHSITAADKNNGLLVANPNGLNPLKGKLNRFSARWVINGYRYQLYVGAYGEEPDTLILDIDVQKYTTAYNPNEGNANMKWGGTDANSADKWIPDGSAIRIGMAMNNDVSPSNREDLPGSRGFFYGEDFTAKEVWKGTDVSLTGPAYKLVTDANGNRITSDYWYAEAEFGGSVKGKGWAGIITDMCGNSNLTTAASGDVNDFYGTGYGYGAVYVHAKNYAWHSGVNYGAVATTEDTVKIGTARIGSKVYVFINDKLICNYYVTDKASSFGIYAGTGTLNDVTVKNFKYVLGKENVDAKLQALQGTTKTAISGKTYNLTTATMGGAFYYADGTQFKSFGSNYKITGQNSADMTDITFSYATAVTGNIYYMEAEFTNQTGWNGIICNTFDKPHSSNSVYYGVGFGYGKANETTNLYLHTTSSWSGKGESLGSFPLAGNGTVRLGVARIYDSYYVFLDGKFATTFIRPGMSTADTNKTLASTNESGMGIFNEYGTNKVGSFKNAAYTTDEDTVRAIVSGAKFSTMTAEGYSTEYVIGGKMDISNPGNGNRYIGFQLAGWQNRFLLWDSDANDTYEYAYTMKENHVHLGNLPASQYLTAPKGKTTTVDWAVIQDGKNAYFLINGEVKLVYTNAPVGTKFKTEVEGVSVAIYDVYAYTDGFDEYQQMIDAIADVRAKTQTSETMMIRTTYAGDLELSHNATTGSVFNDNVNPVVYGTFGNYVYETTLTVEEAGANAHFAIQFPGDATRFLFWNTGAGNTFKITWAYDDGYSDAKYQKALTGSYNMKVVVKDGYAYWFVDGTLMCGIKTNGHLALRIEGMKAHTSGTTVIGESVDKAAYNAAIAGLTLPSITGATRF